MVLKCINESMIIILFFFLSFFYVTIASEKMKEDSICKDDVKKTFASLYKTLGDSQIVNMNITVTTVMRNTSNSTVTKLFVLYNTKKSYYNNEKFESFYGNGINFSVYKDKKSVFLLDIPSNSDSLKGPNYILDMMDSITNKSEVIECQKIQSFSSDSNYKRIKILINKNNPFPLSGEIIELTINATTYEILKYKITYPDPYKIQEVIYDYHKIDYNYKIKNFNNPIVIDFFEDKAELINNYSNYRIIDRRKNKKF